MSKAISPQTIHDISLIQLEFSINKLFYNRRLQNDCKKCFSAHYCVASSFYLVCPPV